LYTWQPKLSKRAIVLFHDIGVRERSFGAWRFWNELRKEYRTLQFDFSHGLGVLAANQTDGPMKRLFDLKPNQFSPLHDLLEGLGRRLIAEARNLEITESVQTLSAQLEAQAKRTHEEWTQRIAKENEFAQTEQELSRVRAAHGHLLSKLTKTIHETTQLRAENTVLQNSRTIYPDRRYIPSF
jgi:hypothetical protein